MSRESVEKKSILITLHGIGTYGIWQKNLQKLVGEYTSSFKCYSMDYGCISPIRAALPFSRKGIVKKSNAYLEEIFSQHQDKDIHIIAHSFGTYLILKYLTFNKTHKNIKTLILSGSMLRRDYLDSIALKYHTDITQNIQTVINECSLSDKSLLITKLTIPNFGDAGRKGFLVGDDSKMKNRYFQGGHKLFFSNSFYKKYWLPHLLEDVVVDEIDERKKNYALDFLELLYITLSGFKYIWYSFSMLLITLYSLVTIKK